MSFLPHLENVVSQVQGALACAVMGFDGITVETHQPAGSEQLELGSAWIEYSGVLNQLRLSADQLQTGALTELTLTTEKCLTLVRVVSPEYFLVLAIRPDGNYGKGRYILRITAPRVKAEL